MRLFNKSRESFNSSVVRLKVTSYTETDPVYRFQFQCGAIKSTGTTLFPLLPHSFQFQCGAIKSNATLTLPSNPN